MRQRLMPVVLVVAHHQATAPIRSHHPACIHCTVVVAPDPPRGPLVGGLAEPSAARMAGCHEGSALGGQKVAYTGVAEGEPGSTLDPIVSQSHRLGLSASNTSTKGR
jgi:hypothetical protein